MAQPGLATAMLASSSSFVNSSASASASESQSVTGSTSSPVTQLLARLKV